MCKVREIRLQKEITQESLAKILNISMCNYCKKELNQSRFSLEQAKTIADFFGMTIEDIFFSK